MFGPLALLCFDTVHRGLASLSSMHEGYLGESKNRTSDHSGNSRRME